MKIIRFVLLGFVLTCSALAYWECQDLHSRQLGSVFANYGNYDGDAWFEDNGNSVRVAAALLTNDLSLVNMEVRDANTSAYTAFDTNGEMGLADVFYWNASYAWAFVSAYDGTLGDEMYDSHASWN